MIARIRSGNTKAGWPRATSARKLSQTNWVWQEAIWRAYRYEAELEEGEEMKAIDVHRGRSLYALGVARFRPSHPYPESMVWGDAD